MKFVVFLCILPIVILIKLRAGITFGSYILFTEATRAEDLFFCVSNGPFPWTKFYILLSLLY